MKTSAARVILYAGSILLASGLGFCWGNSSGSMRATYNSNATTLVWLTGVESQLDRGDLKQARVVTDSAIDNHIRVLAEIQSHPFWMNFIAFTSPWSLANQANITDTILRKTNRYFSGLPDRLRPETRDFLAHH